jgi:hypothetical protein
MSTDNPAFIYGRRGQSLERTRMLLDGSTLTVEQLLEIAGYKLGRKRQWMEIKIVKKKKKIFFFISFFASS